jgi:hypothetical protein
MRLLTTLGQQQKSMHVDTWARNELTSFRRQFWRGFAMSEDWEKKYEWKRTWPGETGIDGKPYEDYSCFDGQYAGRIRYETAGPTKGLWHWSGAYPKPMHGAPMMPNGGYCETAAEAANAVEEYWDAMKAKRG